MPVISISSINRPGIPSGLGPRINGRSLAFEAQASLAVDETVVAGRTVYEREGS